MDRPRSTPTRLGAAIFALVLLGAACGTSSAEQVRLQGAVSTLQGDPADLADFTGTPLVVNFFAESCPPCVSEMPVFEAVATQLRDEVSFLGVSADATAAAAIRIVERTGVTYPIVWDRDGTALANSQSFGLPTTLFVSADGRIIESHTGELDAEALQERIERHF